MEFNEKLQELRKQKGLTQEELARELYVTRAAVSKWESGRGYPNIDSLKAISRYFSVSIDVLLSGEEVLRIAEEDSREKESRFRRLVCGLLDCGTVLFIFLPFFGEDADGIIKAVSLPDLGGTATYLKEAYWLVTLGMIMFGLLSVFLPDSHDGRRLRYQYRVSFLLHGIGVFLFIISRQPYAAAFLLLFLEIKILIFAKKS